MGNRLVYRTHDPAKIAAQVEERVRADLGSTMKVPYEVYDDRAQAEGGVIRDLGGLLVGASLQSLATIVFTLPWHLPASLVVTASRVGLTAQCGSLLYLVHLGRPVEAVIRFEKKAFVGGGPADADKVARLNAMPDLSKRLWKVLRDRSVFSGSVMEQPTHFAVEPAERESRLVLRTLGRPTGLLMSSATTDAGEVLAIAKLAEAALR